MPLITVETVIDAPPQVCFDLARDVDTHTASVPGTGERAVGGVTQGLLGLGDEVTWEARHFAVRQRLTSRITQFHRPHRFVDEMVRGAFQGFRHEHVFLDQGGRTLMVDRFDYRSPLGPAGRLADALFLRGYMERLLRERALHLKVEAELRRDPTRAAVSRGRQATESLRVSRDDQ